VALLHALERETSNSGDGGAHHDHAAAALARLDVLGPSPARDILAQLTRQVLRRAF
jgi:hypothetical protein